jgi:leucyl-tRNA synthetase
MKKRYLRLVRQALKSLRHRRLRDRPWWQAISKPIANRCLWIPCRDTVATGLAIGLFFSMMLMPFQMIPAALIAMRFRANVPFAIAGCWVTNPVSTPAVLYGQFVLGQWLRDNLLVPMPYFLVKVQFDVPGVGALEIVDGGGLQPEHPLGRALDPGAAEPAAEHPLAQGAAATDPALVAFIEECRLGGFSEAEIETMEKKGYPLGLNALHPITGAPVPIFAANFVLMGYGTGAVMAVPAHDQRDWEFAEKYGIPKRQVIFSADGSPCGIEAGAYVEKGILGHSDPFDGLDFAQAFNAIADWLEARGKGGRQVNFRLRDWGVSRQRYWGCPLPVIHGADGQVRAATELPVRLPEDVIVDGSGSPLKKMPAFSVLPNGETRETDTFDTFFESSWYFARYCSPDCDTAMLDERARYWLPVDQYVGGIEHAVLHLLYARFFHKLMRDEGLVACDEPFTNLLTQGMVVAETWYREDGQGRKHWFNPAEVEVERDERGRLLRGRLTADGQPVAFGGIEKMSKSKNNGVDPQTLIDRFGADTVRLYTMFTSPPEQSLEWNDEGVEGASRFLKRVWALALDDNRESGDAGGGLDPLAARYEIHAALRKALFDYERHQFNTVVSGCMTMVNVIHKLGRDEAVEGVMREGLGIVLRLLAPIAPHVTHHLWRELGFGADILRAPWPAVDAEALRRDSLEYVVQVNGKVRGKIQVPADADRQAVESAALDNDNVRRFIGEAQVRKVILVPNKLVNLVVQ